jgi:hypothetical protein
MVLSFHYPSFEKQIFLIDFKILGVTLMCQVASMTVTYIGLAAIQLNPHMSDEICISLGL